MTFVSVIFFTAVDFLVKNLQWQCTSIILYCKTVLSQAFELLPTLRSLLQYHQQCPVL